MARMPGPYARARRRFSNRLREEGGFTLIEVLVAVLLLTIGVLGTFELFDGANAATGRTRAREGATNLAREIVEATRSVPYAKVVNGSIDGELQKISGLSDSGRGGGWSIRRRGFTYDISTSVCLVDDKKDGLGPHDARSFCGAPGGNTDLNPDDYRRLTVQVSWDNGNGAAGKVSETAVMNNPGTAAGPPITTLTMTNPTSSPITTQVPMVHFDVTTGDPAATVAWSVDGTYKGDAAGNGTSWGFNWPIATLYDGTYLVSAQGFDRYSAPGAARVLTVDLNRYPPIAPKGFTGGWNGSVVEFEWLPNVEGDIEGYRVYRKESTGSDTLICGLTTRTTCTDSAPLDQPSTDYYVVAVDRDPAGLLREGAATTKTVVQGNQPPFPPTGLTASADQYGNTVLKWVPPVPADPDTGDTIDFYRIYRDGNTVADRYDRTGTGEISFIDNKTGGTAHTYWISAVDSHYAESTLVGPVTR